MKLWNLLAFHMLHSTWGEVLIYTPWKTLKRAVSLRVLDKQNYNTIVNVKTNFQVRWHQPFPIHCVHLLPRSTCMTEISGRIICRSLLFLSESGIRHTSCQSAKNRECDLTKKSHQTNRDLPKNIYTKCECWQECSHFVMRKGYLLYNKLSVL